ncbi:MAG: hypothetical protein VKL39_12340 [Leptolyngbyaceae bacterium]|nr:hypothetical protein [Leptolyngbyaceae bacterium]
MSLQLTRLLMTTAAIAPILLGTGFRTQAQAQDLNGIFFPRSSEEFFQAGVQRLEEEIRDLQNVDTEGGDRPDLLQIDESVSEQQDALEQEDWRLNNAPDPHRSRAASELKYS